MHRKIGICSVVAMTENNDGTLFFMLWHIGNAENVPAAMCDFLLCLLCNSFMLEPPFVEVCLQGMPWVASSSHTLPHSKQPELTYQIILYLSILGMARDDFLASGAESSL
ncbi:hypothetical protein VQ056_02695 [Paenibacillus sp. JTLBN-2024]